MQAIDMVGRHIGRWSVMGRAASDHLGQATFLCVCECGTCRNVKGKQLRGNRSLSCGCITREKLSARRKRHGNSGYAKTAEYRAWSAMRNRCRNVGAQYRWWNGRGIAVCDRWQVFENFLADMGRRPGPGYSLDRIDVDGNYEPGNVRWATHHEQQGNRRDAIRVMFRGTTRSLGDLSAEFGIKYDTLYRRLNSYGYSVEEAVALPAHKSKRITVKKKTT